jgi:hypothetical protein
MLLSLRRRPVQPETKARMRDFFGQRRIPQMVWRQTHGVRVSRIQVISIHTTNSIFVALRSIEQGFLHEYGDFGRDQVPKLFQTDDKAGPNEATPVRVPTIVDLLRICYSSNSRLFWFFLIIAVPISRQLADFIEPNHQNYEPLVLGVFELFIDDVGDYFQGILNIIACISRQ